MPSILKINSDRLTFLLYLVHILLNFMETPLLKYFYFFEIAVFLYLAFTKKWSELLVPTFVFIMIEGQGRVLGNFNIFIKNIFDIYLIILFIRSYIVNSQYFNFRKIPTFFYLMMLCHFLWYVVQLFNFQNVGFMGVVLASKIYIFPFLFFFMFLNDKIDFNNFNNNRVSLIFIGVLVAQSFLIFHQKELGESHMLAVSASYARPMGDKFIGNLFRPFGTSHLPGGISVYVSYVVCMFFFFTTKNKLISFLKIGSVFLLIFACFTMQVRTAFIQMLLVIFLSAIYISLEGKKKYFFIPLIFSTLLLIPVAFDNVEKIDQTFPTLDLGKSIQRFEILQDADQVLSQRASFKKFSNTMEEKLTRTPLGLGPGRTGAANAMFVGRIKNDLAYDMSYSWTLDNLFVSLAIDLGIGMIFYTFMIVGFPLYFMANSIYRYVKFGQINPVLGTSSVAMCVILMSCWGAIAIPYNPISFFFWFFISSAIIELEKEKTNARISK